MPLKIMRTIRDPSKKKKDKKKKARPSTIHQPCQNIVGPQIRKMRMLRNWSQSNLAVKLQFAGFDVGRECIAKIEGQTRCVRDTDLRFIALVLDATPSDLFPCLEPSKPLVGFPERLASKHQPAHFVPPAVQPKPATPVYFGKNGCNSHNGNATNGKEPTNSILKQENRPFAKNGLNGDPKPV